MKVKVKRFKGHPSLGGNIHFVLKGKRNKRYITANEVMDMLGLHHYKPWEPEYYVTWKH